MEFRKPVDKVTKFAGWILSPSPSPRPSPSGRGGNTLPRPQKLAATFSRTPHEADSFAAVQPRDVVAGWAHGEGEQAREDRNLRRGFVIGGVSWLAAVRIFAGLSSHKKSCPLDFGERQRETGFLFHDCGWN